MWYRAAVACGYREGVLKNIAALGQHIKQQQRIGNLPAISSITKKKMATDLATFHAMQEQWGQQTLQAARFILTQTGDISQPGTTTYQSKHYQLRQTEDSLTVQRLGNPHHETILQVSGDQLTHNSLQKRDCQRFEAFVERLKAQQVEQELVVSR